MQTKPRAARPGDVCVLLEPSEEDVAKLRQLQESLQSLYGGRPHQRVHLTCQRFELREEPPWPDIVQQLRNNLTPIQPFPITATSLVQREHPFWQSRLLRWRIQVTADVRRCARLVEEGVMAAGVTPHFPQASGWAPTVVTALEAIPGGELDLRPRAIVFPQHLFTGRQVVLSKIIGQGQFEILETIQLTDNHCV